MSNTLAVRAGIRLERFSLGYMVLEAGFSLWAAAAAHSVLLAAFGIDSIIELLSGAILLWRLQVEASTGDLRRIEQTERRASQITALLLLLLCLYVLITSVYGLATHAQAESSLPGIAISLMAVMVMPFLAYRKNRVAKILGSAALADDATASYTCAYMAGTVLVGLLLNGLFHLWWAEDAAALVFLFWLGRETWEAFEEAGYTGQQENRPD